MKKINKIIVLVLMVALSIGSIFISPVLSVFAASATIGAAITLSKVPTVSEIGNTVTIPLGETVEGSSVKVTIKDPTNKVVKIIDGASLVDGDGISVANNTYTFTPQMLGDYTVQYESVDYGNYYGIKSEVYTITITGTKPVISLKENTKYIIPEEVGYSYGDDSVYSINLPAPIVSEYNATKKEVEDVDLSVITLTPTQKEALDNETANIEDFLDYELTVYDANQAEVELDYELTELGENKYEAHYKVSPKTGVYGTYSVIYRSIRNNNLVATKKYSFDVKKNFEADKDLSFTWKNGATLPSSAVLGNEISLPTPVVTDKAGNSIDVYTEVTVDFVPAGKSNDKSAWVNMAKDSNELKFTPTQKSKDDGSYYIVKYVMKDFVTLATNGAIDNTITKEYTFTNVSDTEKPVVYLVDAYANADDITGEDNEIIQILNSIPKKMTTNKTVKLPAIYATDNLDVDSDISLSRRYVKDSNNSINFTASNSAITNKENLTDKDLANFTPTEAGKYTFYYEGTDKAGKIGSYSFTIEVEENFADTVAPIITLPTINTSVNINGTIKFDAPSAVDYNKAENEEGRVLVSNSIETKVYYQYEYSDSTFSTEELLKSNESGSYELKVLKDATKQIKNVKLIFRAEDYAQYSEGVDATANKTVDADNTIIVKVNDFSEDKIAPEATNFESIVSAYTTYKQSEIEKQIAPVSFSDTNAVDIHVTVTDPKGDNVTVSKKVYTEDGKGILSAVFNSYEKGVYTVKYTAVDANGNTKVVAYKVDVTESVVGPEYSSLAGIPSQVEIGQEVSLPSGKIISIYGDEVDSSKILSQNVEIVSGHPDVLTSNKFMSNSTGVYTFRFKAVVDVESGTPETIYSRNITIEVVDSYKPTIELDENATWQPVKLEYVENLESGKFVKINDKYVKYVSTNSAHNASGVKRYDYKAIEIPGYTVSDKYVKDGEIISNGTLKFDSVEVKFNDKTVGKVFENREDMLTSGSFIYDSYFKFTPEGDGEYKVIYTATDVNGKTTTIEHTLQVGDCTNPEIALNDETIITGAKVGGSFSIDFNNVKLTDNTVEGEITAADAIKEKKDIKFSVVVRTPSGSTITIKEDADDENYVYENGKLTFNFNEAGDYTVTLTATDNAGRTDPIVKTINVTADNSSVTLSEQAVGIILVVASIALLSGVVIYFVVTNKKHNSDTKKKK